MPTKDSQEAADLKDKLTVALGDKKDLQLEVERCIAQHKDLSKKLVDKDKMLGQVNDHLSVATVELEKSKKDIAKLQDRINELRAQKSTRMHEMAKSDDVEINNLECETSQLDKKDLNVPSDAIENSEMNDSGPKSTNEADNLAPSATTTTRSSMKKSKSKTRKNVSFADAGSDKSKGSTASLNAKASKKLKKRSSRASLRVKSNTRASSSKVKNVSRSSSRNAWHRKPVFCYTGVTVSKGLNKTLSKLNATYVDNYSEDVTHIVMQSEHVQGRTMKLMLALAGIVVRMGPHFL